MSDLLRQLELRRQREGLNDSQFARKLGMKRKTWTNVRLGLFRPGAIFLGAVARTYPEFNELILQELRETPEQNRPPRKPKA